MTPAETHNAQTVQLIRSLKKTAATLLLICQPFAPAVITAAWIAKTLSVHRATAAAHLADLAALGFLVSTPAGYIPIPGAQLVLPAGAPVDNSVDKPRENSRSLKYLRERDRESESDKESLSLSPLRTREKSRTPEQNELYTELTSLGVFHPVAVELIENHDPDTIRTHINQYHHARQQQIARSPGWIPLSLRNNYPPLPGYNPAKNYAHPDNCTCPNCSRSKYTVPGITQ